MDSFLEALALEVEGTRQHRRREVEREIAEEQQEQPPRRHRSHDILSRTAMHDLVIENARIRRRHRGAVGSRWRRREFSATILQNHVGHQGRPLACRLASAEELTALCRAMRKRERGVIEAAITALPDRATDEEYRTLETLVEESGRPVTCLAVFARSGRPGAHEEVVARMAPLLGRNRAIPQVSCRPLRILFTLKNPFVFATFTTWAEAFNRTREEQRALYRSEGFRAAWKDETERRRLFRGRLSGSRPRR